MQLRQRDWRRFGIQLGLLAGVGLAFMGGTSERATAGGGDQCPQENECSFRKPNFMFILDYSTAMNAVWDLDNNLTSWQVAVGLVEEVTAPGGFVSQNSHLALMRFGHDPEPGSEGTTIANDTTGLVDGQVIDVAWDDANNQWFECAGQSIADSLAATPPPLLGAQLGISAWTKGALDRAAQEIAQTKADHPEDREDSSFPRYYVNVVLTQGAWTSVDGATTSTPDSEDPAITAQDLFDNHEIPTYVVELAADPQAKLAADQLAAAGGTSVAISGNDPRGFQQALFNVIQDLVNALVIAPECNGAKPRGMLLLDASSAMLNVDGMAGGFGQTGWDQAREAIAGRNSLFDVQIEAGAVEDLTHLGLAVFGNDGSDEQKLLVQYGPCMKDNFAWALDPQTSCVAPGCDDPWAGPPISWTFQDGSQDPPGFDLPTRSHMPRCDGGTLCSGSGANLHLGLALIRANQAEYHAAATLPEAMFPANAETPYFNILITEGRYDGYSTDAQVQAELEAMFQDGMTTFVVGFGDGVATPEAAAQLASMADWGSGGLGDHYHAGNQAELEAALAAIFDDVELDPCCAVNDCSFASEPTTNEPDPVPGDGDGDGDGDPSGDGDPDPTGSEERGEGDGDPSGDGDDDPTEGDESGGETGETGTDPSADLVDRGCECRVDDREPTRGPLGAALLLGLLGFVRRRARPDAMELETR